ncbi:NAD(P)-binding protein [Trichoderma sp. SZMC 28011]
MTKLIVILGITGTQGASVADVFLQEPGWKLRGVTRDASRASSTYWKQKGVEIVEADLDKQESLEAAFKGANAIFGNIDSIGPMYDPYNYGKLRPGQTINEFCYQLEVKRGKNMANAAARVETLERFVFSGLPSIKAVTNGKYPHAYHFEAKAEIIAHIKSLPNLAAKASEVQLGEFATNWKSWRSRRPVKQQDGSYAFLVPGDKDAPMPITVQRKDTGYFVRALVLMPPGKVLLGYGSFMSHAEFNRVWTKVLGVPDGGVKHITVEEFINFEGPPLGIELAEAVAGLMQFDMDTPGFMHPHEVPKEIGCPTTSIEEYLKSEDFSSMMEVL